MHRCHHFYSNFICLHDFQLFKFLLFINRTINKFFHHQMFLKLISFIVSAPRLFRLENEFRDDRQLLTVWLWNYCLTLISRTFIISALAKCLAICVLVERRHGEDVDGWTHFKDQSTSNLSYVAKIMILEYLMSFVWRCLKRSELFRNRFYLAWLDAFFTSQ